MCFPPKHHSSTDDSNRESGVQVAVAITSPQVLNTCPCRRGWGEMKPRKYTIWEHPTINWWFLKSSSLFVSSCYFQFKDLLPPPKKKKTRRWLRPSLPLQCKKSPILESATLAKPLLVIGMSGFFSEMVLRGERSATHIPQREDDENWSAIGEIVRTFRMNRGEKNEGKTWNTTDLQETLESLLMHVQNSNVLNTQPQQLENWFWTSNHPIQLEICCILPC